MKSKERLICFRASRTCRSQQKGKVSDSGSASRDLIRQSSETLAGRISYLEIGGFSSQLVGESKTEKL